MGCVIYVQHTHPEAAWFDKREEWQRRLGFITTTVNVVVPKRVGQILHDILEHGAHHVNTGVPLIGCAKRRPRSRPPCRTSLASTC